MMAALYAPVAVRRDEREHFDAGPLDNVRDGVCRLGGQHPNAALLPGGDEGSDGPAIGNGGARGGESEPTTRALEAAIDGPGGGRAAPAAARPDEPREARAAIAAKRRSGPAAGGTATRHEEVEQHIAPP